MRVLVTSASRYGSTTAIADAIGRSLSARGLLVDVSPVSEAGDVSGYDAVVLGSGIYLGRWLPPALEFAEGQRDALASRPTWLFSAGLAGRQPKADASRAVMLAELIEAIGPRAHVLFGGLFDRAVMDDEERAQLAAVPTPDGDYRDWAEIEAWANAIADELVV